MFWRINFIYQKYYEKSTVLLSKQERKTDLNFVLKSTVRHKFADDTVRVLYLKLSFRSVEVDLLQVNSKYNALFLYMYFFHYHLA